MLNYLVHHIGSATQHLVINPRATTRQEMEEAYRRLSEEHEKHRDAQRIARAAYYERKRNRLELR